MVRNKFLTGVIASLLGLSVLSSCGREEYVKLEGMIWNTTYHISYRGGENLTDSVLKVFNEVEKSLSVFDENSLVSELNRCDSVRGDRHLLRVYEVSQEISNQSGGVFDPTVSPLITAWGFGPGHRVSADTLAIDSILEFVGIEKTSRRGEFIVKEDIRTQFNFSAIAKGYGADAVGEMLTKNGVTDYMVEIGGEIVLKGKSPGGEDWKIAIDAPIEGSMPMDNVATVISLTDKGIATSGNYRNFRKEGERVLSHTISPKTGRPIRSEILSATVVAESCMLADALATACMASDVESAKHLVSAFGADGMLILKDSTWMSPGFRSLVISGVSEPGRKDQN